MSLARRACAAAAAAACIGCGEAARQPVAARSPFGTADSLRIEGRASLAAEKYRVLRDSFRAAGDTASWWRAELWLADALLKQGKRDSADAAMALAVSLSGRDADRVGWTRYEHSIFLDRVGRFDSALIEARAAEGLSREAHDDALRASTFSAMGRIHSLRGQYREALASNQKAIAIERAYGAEPRVISKEMNELGIDYRHLGRFTDAVAIYDSALVIARRLGNPESIARVEFNLGEIRRETGDQEDALTLFTDALARAEQIGEVRGMAFIHGGQAEIYSDAGALSQARDHLTRALGINRSAKLTYGQLQNLEGLGRLNLREGRLRAADSSLRAALTMADSGRYGKERSTLRAALARTAAARRSPAEARRWADAAVAIADSLGDPEPQAEARSALGVALESARDGAATTAYLDAIDLLESWRGRLELGDLRMGVAEPHLEAYEGAIRTLIAKGRNDAALEVAERSRARLLLELMAERDLRKGDSNPESQLRQQLRERFAARGDASDTDAPALDREIESLTRELDAIQATARANDASAGVRYPVPANAASLRRGLLPNGRALLVFFWGERSVYGWWLTNESVHAARLGSADSLAAMLDFTRGTLERSDGAPDWKLPARRAYRELIAPLDPAPAEEVLVVADGPLATMPLETFIPSGGSAPWGAKSRFVYGPSASVLLALSRNRVGVRWAKGVLAVGDPGDTKTSSEPYRDASRSSDLPALPAAAAEAREVARLFGGDVLVGSDATLDRWLALNPGRYRYLHFATHALLSDRHPQQTSLVLAGSRLDLVGIRRLRLSSELVTLSACETGLGQRVRGEGIIGLPHAFLAAGARSVLVSLWKVEDRTAAEYMAEFYRQLRAGRTPAEAMLIVRQARIRSSGALSHPSHWAPFILVGMPPQ